MVRTEHDPGLEALDSEQSRSVADDWTGVDKIIRESVELGEARSLCNVGFNERNYTTTTFVGCSMGMLRRS